MVSQLLLEYFLSDRDHPVSGRTQSSSLYWVCWSCKVFHSMILVLPSVRTKRKPTPFSQDNPSHIWNTLNQLFYFAGWKHAWSVIVNFTCQLIGLRDAQRTGKTLFLCVSGGSAGCVSARDQHWISRLSRGIYPHHGGLASPNLPRAQTEQKGKGRKNFLCHLELGPPSSVLGHQNSWFLSQHQWPPRFSGLWT